MTDIKAFETSGEGSNLEGQEYINGEKIDSFGTENITVENFSGPYRFLSVNFGNIARGLHVREFNVPRGTQLVLGQVQEGINAGDALYTTLGIAVRAEGTGDWRCRVIWRMSWTNGTPLPTYGRFLLVTG